MILKVTLLNKNFQYSKEEGDFARLICMLFYRNLQTQFLPLLYFGKVTLFSFYHMTKHTTFYMYYLTLVLKNTRLFDKGRVVIHIFEQFT